MCSSQGRASSDLLRTHTSHRHESISSSELDDCINKINEDWVVQVGTINNASNVYVKETMKVTRLTLFWSAYATRIIDQMLEYNGKFPKYNVVI